MASKETLERLKNILSKRIKRDITNEELEQAYNRLMDYATALLDLDKFSKN